MKCFYPIAICVLAAACSSGEHDDLRLWMKENTKDLRGSIPKLPPVIPYVPAAYATDGQLDPFASNKIEPDARFARTGSGKPGTLQPNFDARDQRNSLLEKYPLESLKLIGFLKVNNQPMAVVQVEQHVKQVKIGDYIGQDFGIVIQITDREVALRELVQDSAGDWTERTSTLRLQAKEGSTK